MRKPRAYDLCCGLGGWTDGLLAEGWEVIGYDIEAHEYGDMRYPAELRLQDVMTLNGADLADADLIVASPPCQAYSYMAMPWTLAKAKAADIRADTTGAKLVALNALFNACFRIQREASAAAGRHIPMVVENVRGAIPWVGRSQWNYGSFHLWGDVPALMPATVKAQKFNPDGTAHPPGSWFAVADSKNRGANSGAKNTGGSWFNIGGPGQKVTGQNPVHELAGVKQASEVGRRTDVGKGAKFTSRDCGVEASGVKQPGISGTRANGKGDRWFQDGAAKQGSKSPARKMASAMIAKIPLPLSRHIAATFKPQFQEAAE